jgi:lipopolysaccharide export system protein LptA
MNTPARIWVRRATAALILAAIATVAVLAVVRARNLNTPLPGLASEGVDAETPRPGDLESISEGLEFTERVAGELVFILNSIRSLGLSSGWQEIEGVRLELFNEGRTRAVLNCDAASFNVQTRDARLRGAVHVEFPDGGFLRTEAGRFEAAGRRFVTNAKVVFAVSGAFGQAGSASYAFVDDRLILEDGVIIRMEDGATLQARSLVYERGHKRVRFPDGCRLESAFSEVEAPWAQVLLDQRDGKPVRLAFGKGVTFRSTGSGAAGEGGDGADGLGYTVMEGWSEHLAVMRGADDGWQLLATTNGPWVELVAWVGEDFLMRRLLTTNLRAVIGGDGFESIHASKVVCLRDIPYQGSSRWAEAQSAKIWFAEGRARDMALENEVQLGNDTITGSGARARMSASGGVLILHGDPSGRTRANLQSGRGQVSCDELQLLEDGGRAQARGNVQGRLAEVALLGSAEDGAEEAAPPLHFAGNELEADEGGETFVLLGNARAWQGQKFLFAEEIHLRQDGQALRAHGHVRTTFPARQIDPTRSDQAEVLVVSRSLNYQGGEEGSAVYSGNVRYTDDQHILSSSELTVSFGPGGTITSVEAVGAVDILELTSGRRMTGQRAFRDSLNKTVHMTGSPVLVTDEKGNRHSGTSLTWDQASGRVSITGGPDSQTETIVFPEAAP